MPIGGNERYCNPLHAVCRFMKRHGRKTFCEIYGELKCEKAYIYGMKNIKKHFGRQKPVCRADDCLKNQLSTVVLHMKKGDIKELVCFT